MHKYLLSIVSSSYKENAIKVFNYIFIYAYGENFGGALWQGNNAMVMYRLMESVADLHTL
jgi:hypothetical protein